MRHVRCGPRLRRHWPAYGGYVRPRHGHFADGRRIVCGARSGIRASVFALFATASPSPASVAPNYSFKPTPSRGFVETRGHPRNTGSHLPRSARLNSGVRRSKKHRVVVLLATADFLLRSAWLFGQVLGSLPLRSSSSSALKHYVLCGHRLRKHWSANGWHIRSRRGHFGGGRRTVRLARSGIRASVFRPVRRGFTFAGFLRA